MLSRPPTLSRSFGASLIFLCLWSLASCTRPTSVVTPLGEPYSGSTSLAATIDAQATMIMALQAEIVALQKPAPTLAAIPQAVPPFTSTATPAEPVSPPVPAAPAIATPALPTKAPSPTPTDLPPVTRGLASEWELLAKVVRVIDGDTIEVDAGGELWPVRYIGVDAPETGRPCAEEATQANAALVAGQVVRLVRDTSETDSFGRLLRYVYLGDAFINGELVSGGWAVPAAYPPDVMMLPLLEIMALDSVGRGCGALALVLPTPTPLIAAISSPPTIAPIALPTATVFFIAPVVPVAPPPDPLPAPTAVVEPVPPTEVPPLPTAPPLEAPTEPPPPVPPPPPSGNCDPSYPTVCIPPAPPDLDCGQIGFRRFTVLAPDPHGFDGDFDGIGCEAD